MWYEKKIKGKKREKRERQRADKANLEEAIKAAAATGVQVLYVDSVGEMEKIKKFHPSAR